MKLDSTFFLLFLSTFSRILIIVNTHSDNTGKDSAFGGIPVPATVKAPRDQSSSKGETMKLFIDQCRQAGLKVTPQRLAIYKLLIDSADHPTADWVYRKITDTWPTISFDTVNRTLLTFAEIGVIDMVESYTLSRRFDSQTKKHHHFHCVKCGKIIDILDSSLDNVPVPAQIETSFIVTGNRMVISGICSECAEKKGGIIAA
jgi:Fur family peroxide stress response transcriptional regulator